MCGIAGSFHFVNQKSSILNIDELVEIRDSMYMRGPDSYGLWFSKDDNVALAHRRLSIIDISELGSQPMKSKDGNIVIVFNGEIYNYLELKINLEKKGYLFHSKTDTEVLINLYIEYGLDFVNHIRGMFSIALWDNIKKGILLVRDHFGIKPLYYSEHDGEILFASQVKALLKSKKIDKSLSYAGQVSYFLWGSIQDPFTLYNGIKALEAGTYMWVTKNGEKEIKNYYNLSKKIIEIENSSINYTSKLDFDLLKRTFDDTVSKHLLSDVPVGLFLSSGLDPSILAEFSSNKINNIKAITLNYENKFNESELANKTAIQFNLNHKNYNISKSEIKGEFDKIMNYMDQPSIDGINTYFISKYAVKSGLKVAISGLGGDELFRGYNTFKRTKKLVDIFSILSFFPIQGLTNVTLNLNKSLNSKLQFIAKYSGTYPGSYLLQRSLFLPEQLYDFMDKEIVSEGLLQLRNINKLNDIIEGIYNNKSKISALEFTMYMRNQLLRDSDWAGMAHSLEIRVPFVDKILFEQSISILSSNKTLNKSQIFSKISNLNNDYFKRKKTGFSFPKVNQILSNEDKSRNELEQNKASSKIIFYKYKNCISI